MPGHLLATLLLIPHCCWFLGPLHLPEGLSSISKLLDERQIGTIGGPYSRVKSSGILE